MHGRNILHRDIKLDNVMLTAAAPPQPKLVDLGFASQCRSHAGGGGGGGEEEEEERAGDALKQTLGTPVYMAPEVWDKSGCVACLPPSPRERGPGGLTREVETPLPSNSPHDHMILREHLVDSHGRWKRPCLRTAHMTI
jgi:serine/threonine protein kinase